MKGTDLARATIHVKGLLRSYISHNPRSDGTITDVLPKDGTIVVDGVAESDLESQLTKACASLAQDRGWTLRFEIEEIPDLSQREESDSVSIAARPRTPDNRTRVRTAGDGGPAGIYRLLLTGDALGEITRVHKEARARVRELLRELSGGGWENWIGGGEAPFTAWRSRDYKARLFTYHIEGWGLLIWERAWSVDLLGRVSYPVGAYYDNAPPPRSFAPHIVLRAFLPSPHLGTSFVFDGTEYHEHAEASDNIAFHSRIPSDEITYTEELYLLSRFRLDEFLDGQWRGLPIHLSEEQVEALAGTGPILLSGEAGSGKTVVITQWLAMNHLRQPPSSGPVSQLFVTLSSRLRDKAKFGFDTMLPHAFKTHRTAFKTYGELVEDIIQGAGLAQNFAPKDEMTFPRFMQEYARDVKRSIDPVLLWDEIRSVIKGGATGDTAQRHGDPRAFLDLKTYERLSDERGQCKTPAEVRELYYEEAQKYHAYLLKEGLWDSIDRTRAALNVPDAVPKYLRIACDEVQDLAPMELTLLLRLHESEDFAGLFFAGDIAQVISPSGFTWPKLKGLLGRESLGRTVPDTHYLRRNYRSAGDIVHLVNAVLRVRRDLIADDVSKIEQIPLLPPGVGAFVLRQSPIETLKTLTSNPERRLILTKHTEEKARLLGLLGVAQDGVTVLTIEEAKGLEYEGVLLWNFFQPRHEAITKNDWEQTFVPEKARRLKEAIESGAKNAYALTYEFNLLHVGLTRARSVQFAYDENPDLKLERLGPHVAAAVSPSDEDNFRLHWSTAPATPQDIFVAAERLKDRDRAQATKLYSIAAAGFEKAAQLDRAAECHDLAGAYDSAAACYGRIGDKPNELLSRARSHEDFGDWLSAGKAHESRAAELKPVSPNDASDSYRDAERCFLEAGALPDAARAAFLRADVLPHDRPGERARGFAQAAERARAGKQTRLAIDSLEQAISEAERSKQSGGRLDAFSEPEEWIAEQLVALAQLFFTESDYKDAARAARMAAGLCKSLEGANSTPRRKGRLREAFIEAMTLAVESLLRAGEGTQALPLQREILDASPTTQVEQVLDTWEKFASFHEEASDYDQMVETKLQLADFLLKARDQRATTTLVKVADLIRHKAHRRTHLRVLEKLIETARRAKDVEALADALYQKGVANAEAGHARRAMDDFHASGHEFLEASREEQGEQSFSEAYRQAEKVMMPRALAIFAFEDIALDAYARSDHWNQAFLWAERAAVALVQDIEGIGDIRAIVDEADENIRQIMEQLRAVEGVASPQREDLRAKRKSEELRKAWAETAIALAHRAVQLSTGTTTRETETAEWRERAHASFRRADLPEVADLLKRRIP